MDWRHRGACVEEDPELFFSDGDTHTSQQQLTAAKAVCARCPVIDICLAWALQTNQDTGVWGGKTQAERRTLRRRETRLRRRPQPQPLSS